MRRNSLAPLAVLFTLLLFVPALFVPAQAQRDLSGAADIALRLERLNVLGSVLMIAAHPDDENTALLAYLARGRKLRTGYLSMTRGEGGQNLIGPEQGDLLGVIRTQELLAARRIDGAEQFFTRAIDFGFSKTPEETLEKWGRERILSDTVWTIRHYRPDVVILNFTGTPSDGHGQHQASAILGKEAYFAAADKSRFPEQNIAPWKARRLLGSARGDTQVGAPVSVDIGEYNPLLGKSYNEIAGMSRSQHSSQAMGSAERRGPARTSYSVVAGDPASGDPLDGIDTSWNRLPGGAPVGQILAEAARTFSIDDPGKTIPLLLKARPLISAMVASQPWAEIKLTELDEAIAACAGLWVDVTSDRATPTPGSNIRVTLTALNRSKFPLTWLAPDTALGYNQVLTRTETLTPPADHPYSQPFWLAAPKSGSTYTIERQDLRDRADSPPYYTATFHIQAGSERIELRRPLQYRYVDPERGERTRPVELIPPVAVNLTETTLLFPNGQPQAVQVHLNANVANAAGELRLEAGAGSKVEPASRPFHLTEIGEQTDLVFQVTPAAGSTATLRAIATVAGRQISSGMRVIAYPHIPTEITFPPAEARIERFSVVNLAKKIGYVMGPGDDVPQALKQLGCDVTLLSATDLATRNLSEFDAIVTGVRAYNMRSDLLANESRLLSYVENGGTLVVQYNYAQRPGDAQFLSRSRVGPYPMTFTAARTTVEDAPVAFPNPNHPLLLTPNKISERDFEGWVQERGLYYATQFDPRYQPLFESHDPGDKPQLGSNLYTRYGKGVYIFTAFSWFRQLPAGAPGAYRIFANFISAGKATVK